MSQPAQAVPGQSSGRRTSPPGRQPGRLSHSRQARQATSHTRLTPHGTWRNDPSRGCSFRRPVDRPSSPIPTPPGRLRLRSSGLRSEFHRRAYTRSAASRNAAARVRRSFLFSLLLLLPAAAPADTLDALVITSAVADLATTEWALRASPFLHEANPLMQRPAARVGGKALGVAAIVGGRRYLERHGHKRWSKGLGIAATVLWGGFAINNAVQARRAR